MNNYWKSHDFYLACVILSTGHPLVSLERGSTKFTSFVFNLSPEKAESIISKHWSRSLKVPTRNLIEAINELKTRLHSGV